MTYVRYLYTLININTIHLRITTVTTITSTLIWANQIGAETSGRTGVFFTLINIYCGKTKSTICYTICVVTIKTSLNLYLHLKTHTHTKRGIISEQWHFSFGSVIDNICDVIKQNESELTNTVFKIQPNKANSFFCFLLSVQSFNCFYLCPISVGFPSN